MPRRRQHALRAALGIAVGSILVLVLYTAPKVLYGPSVATDYFSAKLLDPHLWRVPTSQSAFKLHGLDENAGVISPPPDHALENGSHADRDAGLLTSFALKPETDFVSIVPKDELAMNMLAFNDELYLVSAYSDRRKDPPTIRILMYGSKYFDMNLVCVLDGNRYPAQPSWINFLTDELSTWRAGYLDCEVRELPVNATTVEVDSGSPINPVEMPLAQLPSRSKRRTFGLCVKSVYGEPNTDRFVEWMELNALLGVEHVMLYAQDLRGPVVQAMRHYADSGRLVVVKDNFRRLIEQKQPRFVDLFAGFDATHASGDEPYAQFELLSIQDCFHRFRGEFEYIIVADMDEVIVPAVGGTMHDLLRVLKRRVPEATSFGLRAAYYLPNFGVSQAANSSGYTYMLAHTRRTEISWDGAKSFHSTADTESVNWHRRIYPEAAEAYVEHWEAWLHHYRGSCKGFSCDSKVKVIDDGTVVLGRFAAALSSRTAAVVEKLRSG